MLIFRSSKTRFVSSVLALIIFSLGLESECHIVDKRQVGVLARSGALPPGKRSVEALARNGELPVVSNDKRDSNENYALDQFIQELEAAEGLSRLRLQALADRLQEEEYEDIGKRSVAALARNSELPHKRAIDYRSGYLPKPSHESKGEETDLVDPDGFLGKGGVDVLTVNGGFNAADDSLASLAKHGYEDYGEEVSYFDDEYDDFEKDAGEKRHVGAARNFFSDGKFTIGGQRGDRFANNGRGKRNLASVRNFGKRSLGSALKFGKRNIGAAKNFLLSEKRSLGSFRNWQAEKRNVGAARNFLLSEIKRNVGAARNFNSNLGSSKDSLYGKRNIASFARDGGFSSLRYPYFKNYDWDDFYDFDDFHEEEDKRNLGAFKNFKKRSVEERKTEAEEKGSNKTRTKRDTFVEALSDEYPLPVFQASKESDYGELEPIFDGVDLRKRFLGSVASWTKDQQESMKQKRHIGALARLGWLPSFRTTRYSRSGRAIGTRNSPPFRPNSSIGSCTSEESYTIWSSPPSVETKVAIGKPGGIFRRVGRSIRSLGSLSSGLDKTRR